MNIYEFLDHVKNCDKAEVSSVYAHYSVKCFVCGREIISEDYFYIDDYHFTGFGSSPICNDCLHYTETAQKSFRKDIEDFKKRMGL
jgi:hypothetical protein